MEPRLQDLQKSLDIGLSDVHMIVIKGMGGAGKTTLARVTFDSLLNHFEAKSFVENVREVSKASLSGLLSLQRKILLDLAQGDNISSVYVGTNMLKTKLRGSRIIITTRDEQVLIAHRVKWIRDVNLLSDEEAIGLFSRDAFGKDNPVQEYETLSLEVVRYAAGLPLTVKVLGSFLCGKDKPEWVDALARLKTIPLKVLKKLESIKLRKSMLTTLDLGLTPNLVTLDLSYCNDLVELHVLVGCLKRVTCLKLCQCERLKSVSSIMDLESLEVLNVSDLHVKEFRDYIPSHSQQKFATT